MNNLTREGSWDLSKRRRVPTSARQLNRFGLEPGDVLFNATNSPDLVGKTALLTKVDEPMVFSNHFVRLRLNLEVVVPGYLTRWLQMQFARGTFENMCRKWVNQATVSRDALLEMTLPLPPIEEQRRIANILDCADTLRAKRRQAFALLDDLTQSIFLDMFGAGEFETVTAGVLMREMRNGLSPATAGQHPARVLTLSALTRGSFVATAAKDGLFAMEPPADKRVSSRDFLMCRGNGNKALVGVGVYSNEDRMDLVFPDTVIAGRVDPSRVELSFLEVAWRQRRVRDQIELAARTTNGTYKVNQQTLSGVSLPLPSLDLQRQFAQRASGIASLRERLSCASDRTNALFVSLEQRAFARQL